jgi:TPR repeat protein
MLKIKNLILPLILVSIPVFADYSDGLSSYKAGDYESAYSVWLRYAKQGVPSAQFNLGVMTYYGQGVEKNAEHSLAWFKKALEKNYEGARENIDAINQEK